MFSFFLQAAAQSSQMIRLVQALSDVKDAKDDRPVKKTLSSCALASSKDDPSSTGDDELVPQCEVWTQGGKGAKKLFDRCKLNPGHTQFMTWPQFEKASLPDCVTKQDKAQLRNFFDRTVRITVSYTSKNRPDTFANSDTPYPYSNMKGDKTERVGTGLLDFDYTTEDTRSAGLSRRKCPCPECKKSGNPKIGYWQMKVITASHVIYDNDEAANSVFTLFHDSQDEGDFKHLYGIRIFSLGFKFDKTASDYIETVCVTHDRDLGQRVMKLLEDSTAFFENQRLWGSLGIIMSHPHGVSKLISLGNIYECCNVMSNNDDDDDDEDDDEDDDDEAELKLREGTVISWSDDGDKKFMKPCQGACASASSMGEILGTIQSLVDANSEHESERYKKTSQSLTLPFDAVVKIPRGAKFSYKCKFRDDSRFTFPCGTQLLSPDGKSLPLPTDLELSFRSEKDLVYELIDIEFLSYFTYDIPTCPGSSGALLIRCTDFTYKETPHFGLRSTLNLSGLGKGV